MQHVKSTQIRLTRLVRAKTQVHGSMDVIKAKEKCQSVKKRHLPPVIDWEIPRTTMRSHLVGRPILYLDALPRDFPLTIVVQTSLGNINVLSHHQALLRMVVTSFKDRKLMAVLFCPVITLLNDFPSYYFGSTSTTYTSNM